MVALHENTRYDKAGMTDQTPQSVQAADDTVPFGKRDVSRAEKPGLVQGGFRSVADR